MIGRLICWWEGKHLRGKRVRAEENGAKKFFACPRCGRETSYKAASATDLAPQVDQGQQGIE